MQFGETQKAKFKDIAGIVSILVIIVLENQSQHMLQSFANSDFGPSLQQMLQDRLVCGIEDPKVQRRLLTEPDLFNKAFELVLASEFTDQNSKDLQATKSPQTSLNRMQIKQANCAITAEETIRL